MLLLSSRFDGPRRVDLSSGRCSATLATIRVISKLESNSSKTMTNGGDRDC